MLKINASILSEAIKTVAPAVPSRPTHPILGNILLETNQGKVTLKGFDLVTGITATVEAETIEDTSICVPARLFESIVSSLSGEIEIAIEENDQILIKGTNGESKVSYQPSEEYPDIPDVNEQAINFDAEIFTELAKSVLYAASSDETKQVLTGVHVVSSPDKLELAATDGHRLVVANHVYDEPKKVEEVAITIPATSVSNLLKFISKEESFDLFFDDTLIGVKTDKGSIVTRKLDGVYPQYHQLIPKQFEREAIFNAKSFLSAFNFATIALDSSNEKSSVVKVNLGKKGKAVLSCQSQGLASNKSECPVDFKSDLDTFEIAFNSKYLAEAIKNLKDAEFVLNMNEANQPVILNPLGKKGVTALIMPIQIVGE